MISGKKVFTEVIKWRRNKGFHFSPKGKNGIWNAVDPLGVKPEIAVRNNEWQCSISVGIESQIIVSSELGRWLILSFYEPLKLYFV